MKNINLNNDAEILKKKHIISPDVSKMPFRYHDPKQKVTVYFKTEERRARYIERVVNGIIPALEESPLKKGGKNPIRKSA